MMTTGSTYGINERISDPLMGRQIENTPPPHPPAPKTKEQLLQKAVERYSKGEITKEQFETISKALNPPAPVVEVKQKVAKQAVVTTEPETK